MGTGGGCVTCGGCVVGFGVEFPLLWGHWDNGFSKIGPHMVFIWFGEGDAFGGKA